MNREIKFRGKIEKGSWIYGSLVYDYDKNPMICIAGYSHTGCAFSGCTRVIPNSVGQFTGLYDKNGKEIYERDICRIDDCAEWIVEWNNEQACFSFREGNGCLGSASISVFRYLTEIIGNTHDNPELLKGGI